MNHAFINARELYDLIGLKKGFSSWMCHVIMNFPNPLLKGTDYYIIEKPSTGGRQKKEYALSISVAEKILESCRTVKYFRIPERMVKTKNEIEKEILNSGKTLYEIAKELGTKPKNLSKIIVLDGNNFLLKNKTYNKNDEKVIIRAFNKYHKIK